MDKGTMAGIGIAMFCIFGSMIMDGGQPGSLIVPAAMLLVFGGTFGASMASGLMKDATGAGGMLSKALKAKPEPPDATIATMVEFAERARREGLLALEDVTKSVENPFLKKGIELAVDGTDPDELREILENDIAAYRREQKSSAKFFENMGGFAPTLGIIGTVIGLIHVLQNLSDPGKLGPLIAGAFVATLWGVMSANIFWLPIANRMKRVAEIEVHHRELLIEGILSIQAGANPRIVQQRLLSHLSDKDRARITAEAA
jgi:chemotaxis protein MotA